MTKLRRRADRRAKEKPSTVRHRMLNALNPKYMTTREEKRRRILKLVDNIGDLAFNPASNVVQRNNQHEMKWLLAFVRHDEAYFYNIDSTIIPYLAAVFATNKIKQNSEVQPAGSTLRFLILTQAGLAVTMSSDSERKFAYVSFSGCTPELLPQVTEFSNHPSTSA